MQSGPQKLVDVVTTAERPGLSEREGSLHVDATSRAGKARNVGNASRRRAPLTGRVLLSISDLLLARIQTLMDIAGSRHKLVAVLEGTSKAIIISLF